MKKPNLTHRGEFLLLGVLLILAYKLIDNFSYFWEIFSMIMDTLSPFFIGILIAFFMYRPVKLLQKLLSRSKCKPIRKSAKAIATLIIYILLLSAIGVAVKYLIPIIYSNIEELIRNIPQYYTVSERFIAEHELLSRINLLELLDKNILQKVDFGSLDQYIGWVSKIANSFLTALMSIIFSIYLILEKDAIFRFFRKLFRPEKRIGTPVFFYVHKIIELFHAYFSGLFLDAVIAGCASWLVLTCLSVPYAPLLGLLTGIGNMIPFFGPIVSTVSIIVITLLTCGFWKTLWVAVALFVLAQLDSNLLQPKIMSHSVGISPLLVLLAVTIFGGLFGTVGLLLGVPLMATIKFAVNDYIADRKFDGIGDDFSDDDTD